jgi:hypothetical protein
VGVITEKLLNIFRDRRVGITRDVRLKGASLKTKRET